MSEIRANTVSNAAGTGPVTLTGQSAAKAWVNFSGTTSTIAQSNGVSSLTDLGTGEHQVNLTVSAPYTNYCVTVTCREAGSASLFVANVDSITTSSFKTETNRSSVSGYTDSEIVCASVFH